VAQQLRALEAQARRTEFYRLWALAEAHGKRSGDGLRWQDSRRRRFVPAAPDAARYFTWQADDVSLALACESGVRVALEGWPAPEPCYWDAEPVPGPG
jgi:phosphopantetheinyl transferase